MSVNLAGCANWQQTVAKLPWGHNTVDIDAIVADLVGASA